MTRHSLLSLLALLVLLGPGLAQTITPVSNCLGNCAGCSPDNPLACLEQVNVATGQLARCLPYYDGPSCLTGGSYYNIYTENGVLNNFANWSLPSMPQRQQCESLKGGFTLTGLGPFSSNLDAIKNLQFSLEQRVRRLVIKIGVGVSDSRVASSNNSQQVETVVINGTTYIVTTDTTQSSSSTIPFLTLTLTDQLSGNNVISSFPTGYSAASKVVTKCGQVYQFQFEVDAKPSTQFQQIQLSFSLPSASPTLWWIFDFRAEAGCSGFSVGMACDSCLSGFYPSLTAEGYADGCQHCDYTCSTCGTGGVCLNCELYATYTADTQTCSYPSIYSLYRDNFTAVSGSKLNTTSSFFQHLYRSTSRQLSLSYSLINTQSYLAKFYLLYPRSYATAGANFTVSIDGKEWTASNVNANRGTLSSINNGATQLYIQPFVIDRMGTGETVNASSQIVVQAKGTTLTEEFFVGDPTIVQYQCSANCLDCSFSLTQTTTCRTCRPFYRQDLNCLSCAHGFYEAQGDPNRCVKCFSNCKECRAPGRYNCTECFSSFGLVDTTYSSDCIQKVADEFRKGTSNANCPSAPARAEVAAQKNCLVCLSQSNVNPRSNQCVSCWLSFGYVWGRCGPLASSGLSFFATEPVPGTSNSGWKASGLVNGYGCSGDYPNLMGVPNIANNTNHTQAVPVTLSTTMAGLPTHRGIRLALNIFKIDYWAVNPLAANRITPLSMTVTVSAPGSPTSSFLLQLNNSHGGNICRESSKEMIWTISAEVGAHVAESVTVTVNAPDKGVFVQELEMYLDNCPDCLTIGLSYSLFFLPVYTDNSTQTGLDVFVTFSQDVYFTDNSQATKVDPFTNSFSFKINEEAVDSSVKESHYTDPKLRYAKYFIPLDRSYTNATVTASANQPSLVYTKEGDTTRQLLTFTQSALLERFVDATPDTRRSTSQLSDFFTFFSWFALITMIVAVGLGVGVVFQEFSQILQIIYYHVYITSWLLPPTVKVPLSHATRMEHLNYFGGSSVEENLFGMEPLIPSNPIFTQFNIDVYFLRSLYPILIINAIFIGWFIILKLLETFLPFFRNSPSRPARFLRSIPGRPLAYFDQIWRYQYLAVMWACMLQFTSFQGEGSMVLNLVICVLAFVIANLWPLVVTIYTYRRHFTTNVKHFLYLYHDLYYLKTSSLCDEPKSYLYVGIRVARLLSYAVFIALFVNQSIIGPVLLIFINLVDAAASFFLRIYRTGAYLLTRVLENILLIVAAILTMVIYGFADQDTLNQSGYEDLGYGLSTVFVLIIINATVRFFYLVFKKVQEWNLGTYDVGERGELQNFNYVSPVKVPQSERIDTY